MAGLTHYTVVSVSVNQVAWPTCPMSHDAIKTPIEKIGTSRRHNTDSTSSKSVCVSRTVVLLVSHLLVLVLVLRQMAHQLISVSVWALLGTLVGHDDWIGIRTLPNSEQNKLFLVSFSTSPHAHPTSTRTRSRQISESVALLSHILIA